MSKWDWLHAGLEAATLLQLQESSSYTKSKDKKRAVSQLILKSMRDFVFKISRDIQLIEQEVDVSPLKVYVVAMYLDKKLNDSGYTAEDFPDTQDMEYFFKTQMKIKDVIGKTKGKLSPEQIQQSEIAVEYLFEIPILELAISHKSAQESIQAIDEKLKILSGRQGNKNLFLGLGVAGMLFLLLFGISMACFSIVALLAGIGMILEGAVFDAIGYIVLGLLCLVSLGVIVVGTIILFTRGRKKDPEIVSLQAKREVLKKQLLPSDDWKLIVSHFGESTSLQYRQSYDERIAFLEPILGEVS